MKTIIRGGKIVTEMEVLEGYDLIIKNDVIADIKRCDEKETGHVIQAGNRYILPGMVDIHSDMIESYIQPRSTALMDFEMGLKEAERTLTMCGITTMFHSVSMYRDGTWDVKEIRKAPQVRRLANMIRKKKDSSRLIRHRYHLRYEIDNLACFQEVKNMLEEDLVDLISFMDHSPGQGQYKDLEIYKKHFTPNGEELSQEEFEKVLAAETNKKCISFKQLKELSDCASSKGIKVASHDDDTVEKLRINQELGVSVSEFPITMEVAKEASKSGYITVLGAPNVILGGSHSGNLSALDAIREDAAGALVSDYYPQSMLQAVFLLNREEQIPLPKAVSYVSLNPARAVGLDKEIGSLKVGKQADIIIVNDEDRFPVIEQVIVEGKSIMGCTYRKD